MCSVMMGLVALQGIMQHRQIEEETSAQRKAYEAQAEEADQNAKIMDRQREQIADQYAQRQEQLDAKRRLIIGQQNASAGSSGLESVGSVLDAGSAATMAYRNDSMNLLSNQRNDTLSAYRNQINYENQAAGARVASENARRQGNRQLLANFINTAVGIYGAKAQYGHRTFGNEKEEIPLWKTGFTGNIEKGNLAYGTPTIGDAMNNPFSLHRKIGTSNYLIQAPGMGMTKDKIGKGIGRHSTYTWRYK